MVRESGNGVSVCLTWPVGNLLVCAAFFANFFRASDC